MREIFRILISDFIKKSRKNIKKRRMENIMHGALYGSSSTIPKKLKINEKK